MSAGFVSRITQELAVNSFPFVLLSFESKREIEAHIASLQLPTTILRPVAFMDGFLNWNTIQGKVFSTLMLRQTFSSPEKKIQLVACSSIGEVVAAGEFSTSSCLFPSRKYLMN